MTEIYAESFFIINFAADFLIIVLCARILYVPVKYTRVLLSALIGSVYSLLSVFLGLSGIVSIACNIVSAVLMCRISFKSATKKAFVRIVLVFYISAILLGGGLTALSNLLYKAAEYIGQKIPLPLLLLASGAMCFFFTAFGRALSGRAKHSRVMVTAEFSGNCQEFCFLCDTGNLAFDPYSGKPVIVVKGESCRKLLGEYCSILSQNPFPDTLCASKLKMRLVPVSTAAGQNVLRAFTADKVYVHIDGRKNEIDACFALDITGTNNYDGTDGLFPYSLVSGLV